MSCCGSHRQRIALPAPGRTPMQVDGSPSSVSASRTSGVVFVYAGQAPIIVTGGATGRPYRFAFTGARVVVDARDAVTMKRISSLRRA